MFQSLKVSWVSGWDLYYSQSIVDDIFEYIIDVCSTDTRKREGDGALIIEKLKSIEGLRIEKIKI